MTVQTLVTWLAKFPCVDAAVVADDTPELDVVFFDEPPQPTATSSTLHARIANATRLISLSLLAPPDKPVVAAAEPIRPSANLRTRHRRCQATEQSQTAHARHDLHVLPRHRPPSIPPWVKRRI
jgi:hypothetical protein